MERAVAGGMNMEQILGQLLEDVNQAPGPPISDEALAVQLLRSMLLSYRPAKVVEALRIAYRLLRGCSSPEIAAERLQRWREERMAGGAKLSEAELQALSVAGTIAGVKP